MKTDIEKLKFEIVISIILLIFVSWGGYGLFAYLLSTPIATHFIFISIGMLGICYTFIHVVKREGLVFFLPEKVRYLLFQKFSKISCLSGISPLFWQNTL